MDAVDLSTFEKAAAALRRALTLWEEYRESNLAVTVRNSLILEFEICFGQLKSPLQRCLIRLDALPPARVKTMNFPVLLRAAAEYGYTQVDWEHWEKFREYRNETAHAYNESTAEEIVQHVPFFLEAVEAMLDAMRQKMTSL